MKKFFILFLGFLGIGLVYFLTLDMLKNQSYLFYVPVYFLYIFTIFLIFWVYEYFLKFKFYSMFKTNQDIFTYLNLKMLRNKLKSEQEILSFLKLIFLQKDKNTLEAVYLYLKDRKFSNEVLVSLFSLFWAFREEDKALGFLIERKKQVKSKYAHFLLAFTYMKQNEQENFKTEMKKMQKYLKDDLFGVYYFYLLYFLGREESVLNSFREKYFLIKNSVENKNQSMLNKGLFFIIFYFIYDQASKKLF